MVRTAGGAVAALALLSLGGCHGVPFGRVAPAPNRPQSTLGAVSRAALLPATVALDSPSEMAAIDPSNSANGMVTPASAISTSPRADLISTEDPGGSDHPLIRAGAEPLPPTPLLDAALVKARSRAEVAAHPEPVGLAQLTSLATSEVASMASPEAAVVPPSIVIGSSLNPPPEPKPTEAVVTTPPVPPEELWRDGVRKLVGLARLKQEQGGTGTGTGNNSGSEPWGLRARVLAWLAEPDIDPDLGQRDADTVRTVLRALQATTSGDSHAETRTRGDDVRTAVQTLEAKAPLELVTLQICQKVERFGDIVPFESSARRAGEWVVIYCEVDGIHQEPTSNGFQTKLAGRLEVVPEAGGPGVAFPLDTAAEVFPRRRRDYYVGYLKELPRDLAPGRYTLRITLKDVLSDRSASRGMPLTIVKEREAGASTPHNPTPNP